MYQKGEIGRWGMRDGYKKKSLKKLFLSSWMVKGNDSSYDLAEGYLTYIRCKHFFFLAKSEIRQQLENKFG